MESLNHAHLQTMGGETGHLLPSCPSPLLSLAHLQAVGGETVYLDLGGLTARRGQGWGRGVCGGGGGG